MQQDSAMIVIFMVRQTMALVVARRVGVPAVPVATVSVPIVSQWPKGQRRRFSK